MIKRVRRWADQRLLLLVGSGLLLAGLGVAIGGSLYDQNTVREAVEQFYANGGSELISVALTVLVIDTLGRRRATQQEKAALILQMGSPTQDIAKEAVRMLQAREWLRDGSLQGARLTGANLQGALLFGANLKGADLRDANLKGADLRDANLKGAVLADANLQGAVLADANLQGADLERANLQEADLFAANLHEANLEGAKFQAANLRMADLELTFLIETEFDENTVLPDDSRWTPDTDIYKFFGPVHPEFWRSDDARSPAYRGDDSDDD